jgi:hypothetical protein
MLGADGLVANVISILKTSLMCFDVTSNLFAM